MAVESTDARGAKLGWKVIAGLVMVMFVGGFLGGVAGSALHPGADGKTGARGVDGPAGKAGAVGRAGPAGKDGAAGAAAAVDALGVCFSSQGNSSGSVYFLTSAYVSSPYKNADGTVYCPDGTYVPVKAQEPYEGE